MNINVWHVNLFSNFTELSFFQYSIVSGNEGGYFDINHLTGKLSLIKPLDYEDLRGKNMIELEIEAKQVNDDLKTTTAKVKNEECALICNLYG